ncbi:MAG TPA: hypothetical protein VG938_12560 [Verrucomicrobiae bacterium]|jgi:hypothetical protein|nr:hypothetical protein [Verrucomicrobiae bacterium]
MKAAYIFLFIVLSRSAFAADPVKIQVPGFSLIAPANPTEGNEFWMSHTEPSDLSRYALTNDTLAHPIVVTILHYPTPEKAKKAFEMSARGRPQAPSKFEVSHWDSAHRWAEAGDIYLLKDDYLVGVYRLPPDFSDVKLKGLLHSLAGSIAKVEASYIRRD